MKPFENLTPTGPMMAHFSTGDDEILFTVFDRDGEEWASGAAPTIEQAWSVAMPYIMAEWPRSMFD